MIGHVEKAANAMSGKTARACDGCLRRRARWYCAADDAFLCQSCDASVHSANQLARRHERIRLQTATTSSVKSINTSTTTTGGHFSPAPAWHGRKPRTPRRNNNKIVEELGNYLVMEPPVLVPEMGSTEEGSMDENEFDDQMNFMVPVYEDDQVNNGDVKADELEGFNEFFPADLDLAEFAADVESLLGAEIETATYDAVFDEIPVKTEADVHVSSVIRTTADESPVFTAGKGKEVDEEIKVFPTCTSYNNEEGEGSHHEEMKDKLLRLDYESVMDAWDGQGSPWTTGTRPEFKWGGVCWPELPEYYNPNGGRRDDGEREARVLRYREKRRTRLFSKKIRYEVRKLNAEKRPRMKGRFVKRTSFIGDFTTPFSLYP